MAKNVHQAMEELRQELLQAKGQIEKLRAEGDFPSVQMLERWIADAETVLARWDKVA